jgi:LPXTG-motif cell wall-anchored protein
VDSTNIVLIVLALVALGLYMARRRSRLKRDDFD